MAPESKTETVDAATQPSETPTKMKRARHRARLSEGGARGERAKHGAQPTETDTKKARHASGAGSNTVRWTASCLVVAGLLGIMGAAAMQQPTAEGGSVPFGSVISPACNQGLAAASEGMVDTAWPLSGGDQAASGLGSDSPSDDSTSEKSRSASNIQWLTSGDFSQNVPDWNQNELGMYGGCEVVSAGAMMVALGFDVTADDVADHLRTGGEFATSYVGDPYYFGAGYPITIAQAMNETASNDRSQTSLAGLYFRIGDGAELDELARIAQAGVPCLVWTTMYTEEPLWSDIWDGEHQWYDNEHCVVLVGGGPLLGFVQVMDPLDGTVVERDWDAFKAVYDECGKMCVRAAIR